MRAIGSFMAGAGRAAVAALALLLAVPAAWGNERFEVRTAFAEPVAGVWQLNAILEMSLTDEAREALAEGIPLTLVLEVAIAAERRFLPDAGIAELTQRWRLAYDALSDRYVVTNLNSRAQVTYPTLQEALEGLAHVRGLPLVDATLLREGRRHDISLRAAVEIGGLPDAVKFLIFWRDWTRTTDWYTWSIRP
jgi:hypothetical protein